MFENISANEWGVFAFILTSLFALIKLNFSEIKNLLKEHGKDITDIKVIIGIDEEKNKQNKVDHNYFRSKLKENRAKIDKHENRITVLDK